MELKVGDIVKLKPELKGLCMYGKDPFKEYPGKIIAIFPCEPTSKLYTNLLGELCVKSNENTYLVKIEYEELTQYFLGSELTKIESEDLI